MQPELTEQDVEILCEALDAWENRDVSGRLMTGMLEGMFIKKDDPDALEEWKTRREEEGREAAAKKRREAVQVVLLKAKLIQLGNVAEVASIAAADLR